MVPIEAITTVAAAGIVDPATARKTKATPRSGLFSCGAIPGARRESCQVVGTWTDLPVMTAGGCCDAGLGLATAQRGDSWTRSIQRRGALDARHQPLCGRMSKLRFTVETNAVDFFKQLPAFLFRFVQACERRLPRHGPAFFRCGSAYPAGPYLHAVALLVILTHSASHPKISNHS